MKMAAIIYLVLATSLANSVAGIAIDIKRDLDFTRCALNNYVVFIEGIKNIVESSDPLTLDLISGNIADFKFKYNNAQFSGLKDCIVTKLSIAREKKEFNYNLECPRIEMNTKYVYTGQLRNISAQEEGNLVIRTGYYILKFNGHYDKKVGNDKKEHANIKYYHLDFEPRENLVFTFTNVQSSDKEKSNRLHNFMNKNWKYIDKELGVPVLNKFMDVFISHLNIFLKAVPIEELFKTSCQIFTN